jgi:hypothetical protein
LAGSVIYRSALVEATLVKSMADRLFGPNARAKRLAPPLLVLGAVAGAGLGWVTTADFRSNLAATPGAGNPTSTGSPTSVSVEAERTWPIGAFVVSDADLKRAKRAWLERWWMDVQETVKHAE